MIQTSTFKNPEMIKCSELPVNAVSLIPVPKLRNLLTAEQVIAVVCDHLNVTMAEIIKQDRTGDLPLKRQILSFFLYSDARMYKKSIGCLFHRDHTTIIKGLRTLMDRIDTEERISNLVEEIKIKLADC